MRRAWLLALLAVPVIAAAQVAPPPADGRITVPIEAKSSTDDFINEAECTGTVVIKLTAEIKREVAGAITRYQLYASNEVDGKESVDKTGECLTSPDASAGFEVAGVGQEKTDRIVGERITDAEYVMRDIVTAAGKSSCTTAAGADEVIILCVQARDSGGDNIGAARGRLRLSLAKPDAPASLDVSSGERALEVSFSPTNAGVNETYEAEASTDPTFAGTAPIHRSGRVTTTDDVRITGLENFVEYSVRVFAFSDADNRSDFDPELARSGTPLPVDDFWEAYEKAGGREEGGCASGAAGLLALAAVGVLFAFRRRT